jgi:hypothetical protein
LIPRVAAWIAYDAWIVVVLAIALASARVVEHGESPAPERTRCVVAGSSMLEARWCAISNGLDDISDKIAQAASALADARSDAELVSARMQLALLQHEQHDLRQQARRFREVVATAERAAHAHISATCLRDPLAAGCN